MDKLRQRLGREEGFTLIELLIVLVIIGILLAIAVPSYLGFKDRANNRAAESDVRAAIPSMEAYFETNGKYTGADFTSLKAIDSGLSHNLKTIRGNGTTYCLGATVGNKSWSVEGPGATYWAPDTTCNSASSTQTPS